MNKKKETPKETMENAENNGSLELSELNKKTEIKLCTNPVIKNIPSITSHPFKPRNQAYDLLNHQAIT